MSFSTVKAQPEAATVNIENVEMRSVVAAVVDMHQDLARHLEIMARIELPKPVVHVESPVVSVAPPAVHVPTPIVNVDCRVAEKQFQEMVSVLVAQSALLTKLIEETVENRAAIGDVRESVETNTDEITDLRNDIFKIEIDSAKIGQRPERAYLLPIALAFNAFAFMAGIGLLWAQLSGKL